MENATKERTTEEDQIPASQEGTLKEIKSSETHVTIQTAESSKLPEKKAHHSSSRSSTAGSSHQRTSHSLDKCIQSSSSIGTIDIQPTVFGRSGSSISGMTVPIRLDALSYLLNNAIMAAYKVLPQTPLYGSQCHPAVCQTCPCTPVNCIPYGSYTNQSLTSLPYLSQPYINQPGCVPFVNQQGMQSSFSQSQSSNYLQPMNNATAAENKGPSCAPQSGIIWNSNQTKSSQDSFGSYRPETNNWAQRFNDKPNSLLNTSISAERESQTSMQRSFSRYEDKSDGNSWGGNQGKDFGRASGRGDFRGRSWRGNTRSQDSEWRFGDRTRNGDFGSQKRNWESTDSSLSTNQSFKQGNWLRGRGRSEGSRGSSSWQQRNRQVDTPEWSTVKSKQDMVSSGGEEKCLEQPDKTDKGDEDWETDYNEEASDTKNKDPSDQPQISSSASLFNSSTNDLEESTENSDVPNPEKVSLSDQEEPRLSNNSYTAQGVSFEKPSEGFNANINPKNDEEDLDPISDEVDVENIENNIHAEEIVLPSTLIVPANEALNQEESKQTNEPKSVEENDVYTLVLSVDCDDNKEIVLELVDRINS